MVDDHQLAETFEARQTSEGRLALIRDDSEGFLARQAILLLADSRTDRRSKEVGDEGGFTRTRDAADDGESSDGDLDIEALEVAECRVL